MALEVEHHDGVAVLRFVDAERMNSFDPATLAEIRKTISYLLQDSTVKALVVTGSGRAFSTGADVGGFQASIQAGTISQFILDATAVLHPLMVEMHAASTPIVAAVNGVAAGGGLGLALAADVRIGSEHARFAAGYFGIGASPDGGATWFMPRLIGTQRTRRFLLGNEIMAAPEALATGLMDELVGADELESVAIERARTLGGWAQHSRAATKQLLESTLHADLATQLEMERELIAAAGATADFAEGVDAFLSKRPAKFGDHGA